MSKHDNQLLSVLTQRPELKQGEISKLSGVGVSSVQRRMKVFREAGMIKQCFCFPRTLYPNAQRLMLFLKIDFSKVQSSEFGYSDHESLGEFIFHGLYDSPVFKPFIGHISIESVQTAIGIPDDLIAVVQAIDDEIGQKFLYEIIRKLPGVSESQTVHTSLIQNQRSQKPGTCN